MDPNSQFPNPQDPYRSLPPVSPSAGIPDWQQGLGRPVQPSDAGAAKPGPVIGVPPTIVAAPQMPAAGQPAPPVPQAWTDRDRPRVPTPPAPQPVDQRPPIDTYPASSTSTATNNRRALIL